MKNSSKFILLAVILTIAFSYSSRGQTPVSGGIYANTTWTVANSPYVVTGNVVVFPGVTLTIEPGVVVKFDSAVLLEIRQASLMAIGTSADSITFTSSSASPTVGIWDKIYINGGTSLSKFKYCSIKYAVYGIDISSNTHVEVSTSLLSSNDYGLHSGGSSGLTIDSSNFADHVYYGVLITGSGCLMTVNHCNFNNNHCGLDAMGNNANTNVLDCNFTSNETGLRASYALVSNCHVELNNIGIDGVLTHITNCYIYSNSTYGIKSDFDSIHNCQILNNHIGIQSRSAIIEHNDIENNDYGISTYSGNSSLDYSTKIFGNSITNNDIGILTENATIANNVLENDSVGVWLTTSISVMNCNKICNCYTNGLTYAGTNNVSYPNNYWCTTDSTIIESHIIDGYDNVSYGLVNFIPLDTSQCYLTECNLIITATVSNALCDTCHTGTATAHVVNGVAPFTYTWYTSPLQTTQTATHLASGTYTLCVVDSNGCSACNHTIFVDSTNCTGFTSIAQGINATCSTCYNGKAWVHCSGGYPPYFYHWVTNPIQTGDTAYNLVPGFYHVDITDFVGCSITDSVTIGFPNNCSANFVLYADTNILHQYYAVNLATGVAPISYIWHFGDGTTSNQPYPTHIYAVPDHYNICLNIMDSVGCINTYCSNYYLQKSENTMIYLNILAPVGISEHQNHLAFNIYPNPASDFITLSLAKDVGNATIKMYNLLGELQSTNNTSHAKTDIDISKLAAGVYIIEVVTDKSSFRQKFIKE